jgi:hypothetical protein
MRAPHFHKRRLFRRTVCNIHPRVRTAFLDDDDEEIDAEIMTLGCEAGDRDAPAANRRRC